MLFSLGLQKTENINCWYTALDLALCAHVSSCSMACPMNSQKQQSLLVGTWNRPQWLSDPYQWNQSPVQVMNYAKLQLQGNKIITRWHEVNRWQKLFLRSCMSINWQKTYSLCDSEKFWANDRENSQIFSCKTGTSLTQKSDIRSRLWWADS